MKRDSPWIEGRRQKYGLSHELPPSEVWLYDVRHRPYYDRDAWITLTGGPGDGKSTLARNVARRLDPTFENDPYPGRYAFTIDELVQTVTELPRGNELEKGECRVVIWDELTEGGLGREAMTKQNRAMLKFTTVSRERNAIVIANALSFPKMDSALRSRTTDWLHIPRRGLVKAHVPRHYTYVDRVDWMDVFLRPFKKDDSQGFKDYEVEKYNRAVRVQAENGLVSGKSAITFEGGYVPPGLGDG